MKAKPKNAMRPISPREILEEEFGIDTRMVSSLRRVFVNRVPIDRSIANDLAKMFKTTPAFWLRLQRDYDKARG